MDLTAFLDYLPSGNISLVVALVILAAKLFTFTVKPPPEGSKWLPAYRALTFLGCNVGWAITRLCSFKKDGAKPPKT